MNDQLLWQLSKAEVENRLRERQVQIASLHWETTSAKEWSSEIHNVLNAGRGISSVNGNQDQHIQLHRYLHSHTYWTWSLELSWSCHTYLYTHFHLLLSSCIRLSPEYIFNGKTSITVNLHNYDRGHRECTSPTSSWLSLSVSCLCDWPAYFLWQPQILVM